MKNKLRNTIYFALLIFLGGSINAQDKKTEIIPKGELIKYTLESKVFEGTVRDFWIYLPSNYDNSVPAKLMIFQDGEYMIWGGLNPLSTLDSLIYLKEIPITICVFVNYGRFHNPSNPDQEERANRSYEYDTLDDKYARFLVDEIIPIIKKNYNIAPPPGNWAVVGHSSGGICAWTAAWHRPDLFSKVISLNGSFVNIRGGDKYPYLIRNTESKEIKVYLFGGENDFDSHFGNWFLANKQMAAALKFAGYQYKFVIGDGDHDIKNAAKIFPDALSWIWNEPEKSKEEKK